MNERQQQFLGLYRTFRHEDQSQFYQDRSDEFEQSHNEAIILAALLMALTAIVSTLGPMELFGSKLKLMWALFGVLLPALSAALTAYSSLYSFDQQAKLYKDAMLALDKAEASGFDVEQAAANDVDTKLALYVNLVEDVFRKEQGQWGQLISELKLAQAPGEAEPSPAANAPATSPAANTPDASAPPQTTTPDTTATVQTTNAEGSTEQSG